MSLICLSSRGLSDTASNYTNFFGGRGIEFPKNSEICLVGASIKKHSPNDQVHTIPNEANTFAIHYSGFGSANNDLIRDDVIVQEQITEGEINLADALETSLIEQMTCSPLRHNPSVVVDLDSAPATGFTFKFPMSQCRNTLPGYWKVPKNLPFVAPVVTTDTATGTIVTPTVGSTCWIEDSRVLFNTDNQGTTASYVANLEGARFEFTWTTGEAVDLYSGMQGGIVTGDRLLDAYEPHSWVNNPNQTDAENPATDTYEQKIDLGYEIQRGAGGRFMLMIFKNTFVGDGYERQVLATQQVPPAGADQTITILFRPIVAGANAGWEVATKIGAAAYALASLVVGTDDDGAPATATGNFPIGKYNGNALGVGVGINCVQFWGRSNDKAVGIEGCYDDDPAIALIAPLLAFPARIYMAFSSISDQYAADNGITANMRRLAQTRCNSADSFGMAAGRVTPPFNTAAPGLVSDYLPDGVFTITDVPLCIQLPNLPITGFLGGGASAVGGATALPILGIVDAFELSRTTDGICIYEPTQENWIKLMNKDSFTINEIQVRITDLFGVLPDYLDTPTHVWVKIKSGTLEKV